MRPRTPPSHRPLSLLLAALALLPAGCNILAPAYYVIHGPPKTPAAYTLDPERSTVIFVDDRDSQLPRRSLRADIAQSAQQALLDRELVKDMIDGRAALQAAARETNQNPMTVTEIGRAAQAQVVIYVTIERFVLTADGQTLTPLGAGRVKVIDAQNDRRLWPDDKEGYPFTIQMQQRPGRGPMSSSDITQAQRALAVEVGKGIAQLFYEYETHRGAGRGD